MKDRTQVDTFGELKAKVDEALAALERGEGVTVPPEETEAFFARIRAEARAEVAAKRRVYAPLLATSD